MTEASLTALAGVRVLCTATGIAGLYAAQLLAQAGADVTVAESSAGAHRLRRRHTPGGARAGVLFDHLTIDTTVTVVDHEPAWADIDILVADAHTPWGPTADIAAAHPRLLALAVSPHGTTGPWADRPGNDFTAQAGSGALLVRGLPGTDPVAMGGEQVEWLSGAYGAVALVASWCRRLDNGIGDFLDLSLLETGLLGGTTFADLYDAFRGRPPIERPARMVEVPSIEPAADGWIGVTTNTQAQFDGFLDAIGRPDLIGDSRWTQQGRIAEHAAWFELVHAQTTKMPVAELLARCLERRVPAAIVNDASRLLDLDHAKARGTFVPSTDGTFQRPRTAWRIHDTAPAAEPAGPATRRQADTDPALPLAGVRVIDLTAWWAGPSSSCVLAAFGADVIHVEAPGRPDGLRMTGLAIAPHERWYDRSFFFHQTNTNKRGLVVDAASPDGRQLLLDLIAQADVLVENFTPRVMENFGLDWDAVSAVNPSIVMTRLPAFGLDGPWRDQPGFAQTMEQITGLAWVTGHEADQPRVPRGPCDPNGGMHGAIATILAVLEARRTGVGHLVESTLFDAAVAIAAEQVVEFTANGVVLQRHGNRNPHCVPQGLYPGREHETWLAVSCEDDDQWLALVGTIDTEGLRAVAGLDRSQRWERHDEIDAEITAWSRTMEPSSAATVLAAAGVCAVEGRDPRRVQDNEQMVHRGFFEAVDIDTIGEVGMPTWPFRSRHVERWTRFPSPAFGADNLTVLAEYGIDDERIAALTAAGVIADKPAF